MVGGNYIKLTVNERILIHLRRYYTARMEAEASQAVTQKGIADAIDIRVTHVPRSVKKLDEEGLIYESVMHIKGVDKRRKAYFLTEKGMYKANELKKTIEERSITYKDSTGTVWNFKLSEVGEITGMKLGILNLVKLMDSEGILSQKSMEKLQKSMLLKTYETESKPFHLLQKLPSVKGFVGRKKELESLQQWIDDASIVLISVHGVEGIGKTALVAKSLTGFKNKEGIFWFEFGNVEGFEDMIEYLSDFLGDLNRNALKSAIKAKDKGLGDMVKATLKAVNGTNALVILDSLDEADSQSQRFVSMLCQSLDRINGAKIIILHKAPAKKYIRHAPESEHFRELLLKGLDRKSCISLLNLKKLDKNEFERIFRLTEGSPRALKLIKSEDISELKKSKKYTPDELTLIKYLKSLDKI